MKPTRRLFHYSLRTMLIGTAAIAAGLGWYVETVWPQQRAVGLVVQSGGSVFYDAYLDGPGMACFPRQRSVQGSDSHAWLDLRHNVTMASATDAGDPHELCRRLAELPKLHSLSLIGLRFNDQDLQHIGRMTEMFDLELGRTSVTDRGLQNLARLKKLELLELPAGISDAGLKRLQTALPQCCITRIAAEPAHQHSP
jgi:hypothetical protein